MTVAPRQQVRRLLGVYILFQIRQPMKREEIIYGHLGMGSDVYKAVGMN